MQDLPRLREAVVAYSDLHHHVEDHFCLDLLLQCGPAGLDLVADMLREEVGGADELVACYCVELIIRSRMPGRVDLILEALRLPLEMGIRYEVRETIFDWAAEDPEFLADPRMVAAAEEISATWFNTMVEKFLRLARAGGAPDPPGHSAGS